MLDLKIVKGQVIDGNCDMAYKADIGILGDKIVQIGELKNVEAKIVMEATGKVVAPGFVDIHTHSDISLIYDPRASSKIYDGVTTQAIANCGIGVAPISDERKGQLIDYLGTRLIGSIPVKLKLPWNTMGEYLGYLEMHPTATNVTPLVAQGVIRINEMGFDRAEPTRKQLERMKHCLRQAMEEGCVGMSSGLVYMPGEFTTAHELAELCTVLVPFGGFYVTHLRNEADGLFAALEEAIVTATRGGVALHVSHLKLSGPMMGGRTDELLVRIEQAKANGLDISFDVYPYTAGCTSLGACMPPWAFEGGVEKMLQRIVYFKNRQRIVKDIKNGIPGWQNFAKSAGGWQNVTIASVDTKAGEPLLGKTIAQLAEMQHKNPYDVIFDTLIQENGRVQVIVRMMREEDVEEIISHPMAMIGSDGMNMSTEGIMSAGKPHPRAFGTFARVLAHYTRKKGLLTLEEAVKKMTSMPARRLGLDRRGCLKKGHFADVVIFDPDQVQDMATYEHPLQYSLGFDTVIVNGQIVLQKGRQTDSLPGRVLRGLV